MKKEVVTPEGKPPLSAHGMVSEDDLKVKEMAEKTREGKIVELPDEKVLLLYIGEGIYDLNRRLEELLDIFRKAGKTSSSSSTVQPKPQPKVESKETKTTSPLEIAEGENRVDQLIAAFARYAEKVTIDIEADSMFVIVKPRGYLAGGWSEINNFAKEYNATWVSQGKESHWKIPKMVKKSSTSNPKEESESRPKSQGPPSDIEGAKLLFTKDQENLLTFEVINGGKVKAKPKKFLTTETFTKIASTVRSAGGEYVSAGEDSHFWIPIGAK